MKHTVTEITLKNGAKGLFIHVPDASVLSVEINFRAGEFLVDRNKWETAHLMEHILLGANKQYLKSRDFQAEFEKNGAYNNASTSTYDITYESECADFEWDRILGLMLTAISEPLFLQDEFKAEFGNVKEELTARSNNHFRHLNLAMREAFGLLSVTDQERLVLMPHVTQKDVVAHYKKTHTTKNMRFVIAGSLPPSRQETITQLFEDIGLPVGTKRIALPNEIPKLLKTPLHITNGTVDNMYFYIDTFLKRRLSQNEHDALGLVNSYLTETFYSRIFGTARERGLVYSMSSGISEIKNAANWWFGAQVLPTNAKDLFEIIVEHLQAVFSGKFSEDDLKSMQQYALGRYQRSAQTVGGTAAGYSSRYFFDEEIEDYYAVPQRIDAVSLKNISDATKAMFNDRIWGFGVLGNAGKEQVAELQNQISRLWK